MNHGNWQRARHDSHRVGPCHAGARSRCGVEHLVCFLDDFQYTVRFTDCFRNHVDLSVCDGYDVRVRLSDRLADRDRLGLTHRLWDCVPDRVEHGFGHRLWVSVHNFVAHDLGLAVWYPVVVRHGL